MGLKSNQSEGGPTENTIMDQVPGEHLPLTLFFYIKVYYDKELVV